MAAGADACIFDLEDSVLQERVVEARQAVREALHELAGVARIWVRVHPASSPLMAADLAALPLHKTNGIMLPKVGRVEDLAACKGAVEAARGPTDLALIPIIESAAGAVNLPDVARGPSVFCLAFGRLDLSADLAIDPARDSDTLAAVRAAMVLHSRAADLHPPLESPWVKIKDLNGLRSAVHRARADGFGGMQAVHPSQLGTINRAFSVTEEEIAWATGILASADQAATEGRGAYALGDEMVDEAVIRRARRILQESK